MLDLKQELTDRFHSRICIITAICTIFVVYVHSDNLTQYSVEGGFVKLFEDTVMPSILGVAVPIFYFISGYLFFRNYSWQMVLSKYKSRFRSLVLPYLLWNLLYTLIAIFFSVNPIGIYMNDSWKMIPISIKNVFQGVLYFKYLPVFWFMFYLIIYIILGPVLYLALKNKWGGMCFIIAYLALLQLGLFYTQEGLLTFAIGGYIAINHSELLSRDEFERNEVCVAVVLLLIMIMFRVVSRIYGYTFEKSHLFSILFTLFFFCVLYIVADYLGRISIINIIGKYHFFIYATHLFILSLLKKIGRIVLPCNSFFALITYAVLPMVTIVFRCLMAVVLDTKMTRVYKVLSGFRND